MKSLIGSFIGLVLSVSVGAEPLLEGQVRLSSGQPAAGVQVRLFDLTDLRRFVVTTTDETGHFALLLQTFSTVRGTALPTDFALGQNYPNPFNPSTVIPYQLPTSAHVRLEVFNLLGQRLATLVDAERSAGVHTAQWDATDAAGRAVGAGVYIYRLSSGGQTMSRRMVLVDGQAGIPAAAAPVSVRPAVEGEVEADGSVYGLTVSGAGLVAYVNPTFRVGVDEVDIVVEEHSSARMKLTADGVLGDVDGNGQVDVFDVLYVLLYSVDSSIVLPNNGDISRGDVNGDGLVDVADSVLLLRYLSNPSDPALPPGIGQDPDDTLEGATPVDLGSSTDGSLSEGDTDYFRVEMSSAGTLIAYTTGSVDTEGAILDSSGTVLARNSDSGAGYNFEVYVPVDAGTYYIEIKGWRSSTTGDYTLHVVGHDEAAPVETEPEPVAAELTPEIIGLYDTLVSTFTNIFFAALVPGTTSVPGAGGGSVEIAGNNWTLQDYSPDGALIINGALYIDLTQDPIPMSGMSGEVTLSGSHEAELILDMQLSVGADGLSATGTITINGAEFDVAELSAAAAAADGTCTIDSELVGTWTIENADASGMIDAFVDYYISTGLPQTTAEELGEESKEEFREGLGDEIRFNADGSVFGEEDAPTSWCIEDDILFLIADGDLIPYKYFLDGDELHLTYTKAILLSIVLEAEDLDAEEREMMESIFEPFDEDYVLARIVLKSSDFVYTPSTPSTLSHIYWTDLGGIIYRASLDGSNVEPLVTRPSQVLGGLALDVTGDQIYWTGLDLAEVRGIIYRASLDGSNIEPLFTGEIVPNSLALDVARGQMYWMGSGLYEEGAVIIYRASLDGSNVEPLFESSQVLGGLALDVAGGQIYWAEPGDGAIYRASLDGSRDGEFIERLVTTGRHGPVGLALDVAGGQTYWTVPEEGIIYRASLDGSNVEPLISGLNLPLGLALDVAGGQIYWTDSGGIIYRASLDGSNIERLVTGLDQPRVIVLGP